MKVLVTGANGFIGTYLCQALVDEGHELHILARPSSDLSSLGGVKYTRHLGDVTDLQSLIDACQDIDTVFHLAAFIGYSKSERAVMEKVNVAGTKNVLDACVAAHVRKLLVCSSIVAVGANNTADEKLLNEDSEYNMGQYNLGYFETKRKAEMLVLEYVRKGLVDAVILNPSNVYGAGDAAKTSRSTQIKVAAGRMPFYTGGGINIVRVQDVVAGFLLAWNRGRSGERYILGGDNISVKELLTLYAEAGKVRAPFLQLPTFLLLAAGSLGFLPYEKIRPAQMYLWYDCSKAKRELGFDPKPARVAVQESVEWMKTHGYLDKYKKNSSLFKQVVVLGVLIGIYMFFSK